MSEHEQPLTPGIDLSALRLTQRFAESLSVKRLITRVPVRKPIKTEYVRVRVGEQWRLQVMCLELKAEGETYLVMPEIWEVLPGLLRPVTLRTGIDRHNNVILIPVQLPGPDGRMNSWHQSLAEAVSMSETKWVRIIANMAVGGYDVMVAQAPLPEPEWPDLTFQQLIDIAFRDRVIHSIDHPVVTQLLGRS